MNDHNHHIETPRLLLRQWRESDLAHFGELCADPEVMRYFPATLKRSESNALADRIRSQIATRGWGLWALQHEGEFIGFTGLSEARFEAPFTPAIEVGWRLRRSSWGMGLASETARASLRYARDTLGLSEVVSFTAALNKPSRAVMERIGMARDPREDFEHPLVKQGDPLRPHVLYRWRPMPGSEAAH